MDYHGVYRLSLAGGVGECSWSGTAEECERQRAYDFGYVEVLMPAVSVLSMMTGCLRI